MAWRRGSCRTPCSLRAPNGYLNPKYPSRASGETQRTTNTTGSSNLKFDNDVLIDLVLKHTNLVLSSKVILQNLISNGVKAPRTTGTDSLGTVMERQRKPLPQDSQKAKEEADLAECRKQFRVAPVPEHVSKPLYDDLIHEQERLRKEGREQRRDFLLTTQKPFRLHKKEEKKRERLKEDMSSANKSEKTEPVCVRKPIPKAVSDHSFSEQLKGAIYLNIFFKIVLLYTLLYALNTV